MNRIVTVMRAEFRALVRTRAFILLALSMPLFGLGSAWLATYLQRSDTAPRRFAVIDASGNLYDAIAQAAANRNANSSKEPGMAPFFPERISASPTAAEKLALSDRIRSKELFAFLEIPKGFGVEESNPPLRYYSATPNDTGLSRWLSELLTNTLRQRRYAALGIDGRAVASLERPIATERLGIYERGANGEIQEGAAVDMKRTAIAPMIGFYVLFILVLMGAPLLLQAVVEEKSSRISEVLLGLVEPTELMIGKLLAACAGMLLIAALYVAVGLGIANRYGWSDLVSPHALIALPICLVLALGQFGAIFLAIGAAVSSAREAQSLLMPVNLLFILPAVAVASILQNPTGPLAMAGTFIPLWSPLVVMVRVSIPPGPPAWQLITAALLCLASIAVCVWAAGRIFRIGLLLQGKPPSLRQLAQWVVGERSAK